MRSTMQDVPLQISSLFEHGLATYGGSSRVIAYDGEKTSSQPFSAIGDQARRLANALRALGVDADQRVGTLMWNTPEHLVAYFGVPAMGAVLHTLNMRLSEEQLAFVIGHAGDEIVIVDHSLVSTIEAVLAQCPTVRHLIVVGQADVRVPDRITVHDYEDLLAAQPAEFVWPAVDERSAASICYTTGTTGEPKGVAYSHRSTVLHSMSVSTGNAFGLTDRDRIMPMVPMFHANAWGWPYAGWMCGSDIVLTGRYLQGAHLAKLIETERPTALAAVPTIWHDLVVHGDKHGLDMSSVRIAGTGGSTLPRPLAEAMEQRYDSPMAQGWGMTETSPLVTWSEPPRDAEEPLSWRLKSGRILAGVQVRIVDDAGEPLADDGTAMGELELRGPWITGSYLGGAGADRFHDGWLRTGDLGTIDHGWVVVMDRTKDGIKSGGEWIPTLALEAALLRHPQVDEALVIGIPDEHWQERPLACVVLGPSATVGVDELREHLVPLVPRWWLPDAWSVMTAFPRTTVGKQDKKAVRAAFEAGDVTVVQPAGTTRAASAENRTTQ